MSNESLVLVVDDERDHADGIVEAADKIDKIFDPYYSSRPDGSGLGLATAKRIVKAHKGTIAVAAEQGKGTSFTIELPLAEAG